MYNEDFWIVGLDMEQPKRNKKDSMSVEFLRLFVEHQKAIYAYILALVHQPADAEDVMQNVVTLMWERFEEFEPGTNFGAWGVRIARLKALEYHRSRKRDYTFFSDDLFDYLSQTAAEKIDTMDDRLRALQHCLVKLGESDRRLVQVRYEKGLSIKQIAGTLQRPLPGLYKVMGRIHRVLVRCVQMTLHAWEMGA
jgi:RNA polymerase sigma-70 factor (ECF subfamily)